MQSHTHAIAHKPCMSTDKETQKHSSFSDLLPDGGCGSPPLQQPRSNSYKSMTDWKAGGSIPGCSSLKILGQDTKPKLLPVCSSMCV